jgi:hypothetical protein
MTPTEAEAMIDISEAAGGLSSEEKLQPEELRSGGNRRANGWRPMHYRLTGRLGRVLVAVACGRRSDWS